MRRKSVLENLRKNNYGKNIHQRDICTGKGDKSRSMNTERERKMDKQQVLNQLRNAKEIYVIMSLCTKMPYVVCDKETFDDEVMIYFNEEDIRREGKRLIEEKIPVQIAKVDANQMLHFYGNLYTMGVNCLDAYYL